MHSQKITFITGFHNLDVMYNNAMLNNTESDNKANTESENKLDEFAKNNCECYMAEAKKIIKKSYDFNKKFNNQNYSDCHASFLSDQSGLNQQAVLTSKTNPTSSNEVVQETEEAIKKRMAQLLEENLNRLFEKDSKNENVKLTQREQEIYNAMEEELYAPFRSDNSTENGHYFEKAFNNACSIFLSDQSGLNQRAVLASETNPSIAKNMPKADEIIKKVAAVKINFNNKNVDNQNVNNFHGSSLSNQSGLNQQAVLTSKTNPTSSNEVVQETEEAIKKRMAQLLEENVNRLFEKDSKNENVKLTQREQEIYNAMEKEFYESFRTDNSTENGDYSEKAFNNACSIF